MKRLLVLTAGLTMTTALVCGCESGGSKKAAEGAPAAG
jgi:hypothetical protein